MFNKVYMEEEKLLNFCKITQSRIDSNKKFRKTDKADLLKLLRPEIPDKVIENYKKNSSRWKEDNLLYHFDKLVFPMFLTGLSIAYERLEPNTEPEFVNKFDYRYMDGMVRSHLRQVGDLEEELEDLQESNVSIKEYHNMLSDKNREIDSKDAEIKKLEEKLEAQREHFEAMRDHDRKTSQKQIQFYENMAEQEQEEE